MTDEILADLARAEVAIRRARMRVVGSQREERLRAVFDLALRTGALFIASDVQVTDAQRAELDALGVRVAVHPRLEPGTVVAVDPGP